MRRITLIHTGGTIAMAPGPQGLSPQPGLLETEATALAARLRTIALDIEVMEPLLDSAAVGPEEWNGLAERIAIAAAGGADGIVVTHGTDTLAHTAAALDLARAAPALPLVLTGSMRPPGVPGSDARRNLADAFEAAAFGRPGVRVAFAGRILRGDRVVKLSAEALDAFVEGPGPARPVALPPARFRAGRIAVLTVTPGMTGAVMAGLLAGLEGAVIRLFGSGTLPPNPGLVDALEEASAAGTRLIAVSACAEGAADLSTYAAAGPLRRLVLADDAPMTAERAFVLLSMAI